MNAATEAALRALCGADPAIEPGRVDRALAVLADRPVSPDYIPPSDRASEREAASILGVTHATLCRWRLAGRVPAGLRWMAAAGGRMLWSRTDCLAWASARVNGG